MRKIDRIERMLLVVALFGFLLMALNRGIGATIICITVYLHFDYMHKKAKAEGKEVFI